MPLASTQTGPFVTESYKILLNLKTLTWGLNQLAIDFLAEKNYKN
jgi:hypothetical protein